MEGISGSPSKFDRVKNTIADRIHEAADSIRQKTESDETPSAIGDYGKHASSLLDQSAEYIRDFDVQRIDTQIRGQIRNNPGRSLLIAMGAGLLLGMWLRRR